MSFDPNNSTPTRSFVADTVTFDQGLRRHMISVYNKMMLGLAVTGLAAFFTAHNAAMMQVLYGTSLRFLIMLAPLAFVMVLSFGIRRLSVNAANLTFYGFSAVMGLSLASIFMVYSQQSIALVFFITAATFAAMSLYGYTTRTDLTRMGSFLFMGLIGIVIASLVNMFLHSSGLQFIVSIVGVLVFTGLTAYNTQQIRDTYSESYGVESNAKLAVMGALSLYLDFINLFMMILRLVGNRR
jgi:FtsH-binding integral membrane protein